MKSATIPIFTKTTCIHEGFVYSGRVKYDINAVFNSVPFEPSMTVYYYVKHLTDRFSSMSRDGKEGQRASRPTLRICSFFAILAQLFESLEILSEERGGAP